MQAIETILIAALSDLMLKRKAALRETTVLWIKAGEKEEQSQPHPSSRVLPSYIMPSLTPDTLPSQTAPTPAMPWHQKMAGFAA